MTLAQDIFDGQLVFGSPETVEGITVLPIGLEEQEIDIKTISQAVEEGLAEVLESESVNILKLSYSSPDMTLIPYLQVVTGGKQDRMVTMPIILAPSTEKGEIRTVPVNCVEQGRWTYSRGGVETGTIFKMEESLRMSPSMGAINVGAAQDATWSAIRSYRTAKARYYSDADASSQSFAELEEIAQAKEEEREETSKEVKELLEKATDLMENQTGLAIFIGDELIGMEVYGTSKLWEGQKGSVRNSFLSELSLREAKGEEVEKGKFVDVLQEAVNNLKYEKTEPIELGKVSISKGKDHSALMVKHDKKLVEFYYAKRHEGFEVTESGSPRYDDELLQRLVMPEEAEVERRREEDPPVQRVQE